jgi:hypothetical protein
MSEVTIDRAMSEALSAIHDEAMKLLKLDLSPEADTTIRLIISIARHQHDVRTHEERGRSATPCEAPGA